MSINHLLIVTAAVTTAVTVAEAKSQLRVTHGFEDAHISRLIKAASAWAQQETKRIIMSTVVDLSVLRFPPRAFVMPGGKVTAVESITYQDEADATQVLKGATSAVPGTAYQEDLTDDERAFVYPVKDNFWPAVITDTLNAVTIRYTVGYGAKPEDVPEDIRQAILFKLADQFTTRDSSDGKSAELTAAENLLHPHVLQFA